MELSSGASQRGNSMGQFSGAVQRGFSCNGRGEILHALFIRLSGPDLRFCFRSRLAMPDTSALTSIDAGFRH
ncbi:hypothetical protein ABZ840_07555 [Streptomyces sp. NPDC047117]|uniref:hypothetical protein n=1 Tax=Streptomyces sp. NPDC047117 TaxID=3155379 RepID=UPI00340745AE